MTSSQSHWLELESDPGLFTLLLEDFGVQNVQVEEIYDLSHPIENDEVYGFIFLFKWEGGNHPSSSGSGNKTTRSNKSNSNNDDKKTIKDSTFSSLNKKTNKNLNETNIFFAHQIVPNSCATHALLSILMNCEDRILLGDLLTRFKERTKDMTPEKIGEAIGEMPELAEAHNRHARQLPSHENHQNNPLLSNGTKPFTTRRPSIVGSKHCRVKDDTFHFVCYIPIHGCLYELDGLKPFPINHGQVNNNQHWTEHCRQVIQERMQEAERQDLRYNLMAVVPDRRVILQERLSILRRNYDIIETTLNKILDHIGHALLESDFMPTVSISHVQSEECIKSDTIITDVKSTKPRGRPKKYPRMKDFNYKKESITPQVSSLYTTIDDSDSQDRLQICDGEFDPDPTEMKFSSNEIFMSSEVVTNNDIQPLSSSTQSVDLIKRHSFIDYKSLLTQETPDITRPLSVETQFIPITDPVSGQSTKSNAAPAIVKSLPPTLNKGFPLSPPYSTRLRNRKVIGNVEVSTECKCGNVCRHSMHDCASKIRCFTPHELCCLLKMIDDHIKVSEISLQEEIEKRKKFEMDDARRTFNYENFIEMYLLLLHESGHLKTLLEKESAMLREQDFLSPPWKMRTRRSKHRRK